MSSADLGFMFWRHSLLRSESLDGSLIPYIHIYIYTHVPEHLRYGLALYLVSKMQKSCFDNTMFVTEVIFRQEDYYYFHLPLSSYFKDC